MQAAFGEGKKSSELSTVGLIRLKMNVKEMEEVECGADDQKARLFKFNNVTKSVKI